MYPNGKAAKQRLADELKAVLEQGRDRRVGGPERPMCVFPGDSKERLADELREALEQGSEDRVMPDGATEDRKADDESDRLPGECRTKKSE